MNALMFGGGSISLSSVLLQEIIVLCYDCANIFTSGISSLSSVLVAKI